MPDRGRGERRRGWFDRLPLKAAPGPLCLEYTGRPQTPSMEHDPIDHAAALREQAWLDRSLAERWDLGCRGGGARHIGYGFLWRLNDIDGYRVWNAAGYGGQEVWIAPDVDLIVVLTPERSDAWLDLGTGV